MSENMLNKYFAELNRCNDISWVEYFDIEKKFLKYLDFKTFKFVNSATNALMLIFKYIHDNIRKNKDKLTIVGPAFSHPAWISVCKFMKYDIIFADVSLDTLCLSLDSVKSVLNRNNVDVLLFINMCGYVGPDVIELRSLCDRLNIIMIEDSAHAFDQKSNQGVLAGSIGHFCIYSFSEDKILSVGEGGAIGSKTLLLNDEFEKYIYHGGWYKSHRKQMWDYGGLNCMMPKHLAKILSWQLNDINKFKLERFKLFNQYREKFNLIHFPSSDNYYAPSFFAYRNKQQVDLLKRTSLVNNDLLLIKRYRNMSFSNEFVNSQILEDSLVYLKM